MIETWVAVGILKATHQAVLLCTYVEEPAEHLRREWTDDRDYEGVTFYKLKFEIGHPQVEQL